MDELVKKGVVRLSPENCYLFICDIQENEKLNSQIIGFETVLETAKFMVKAAETLEIPTVVTEHNPKVFGRLHKDLRDCLEKLPKESTHNSEKTIFSMFTSEVQEFLKKFPERKNVILVGIETHVCVQQTCLDLRESGFEVHLLTDGVSSRKLIDRTTALQRVLQSGVYLTTSESAVFELVRDSKSVKFKALLPLIKEERRQDLGLF